MKDEDTRRHIEQLVRENAYGELATLALSLLKENSELRVRDSNVTFHSKNVMGVNEDLVKRLARYSRIKSKLETACVEWEANDDYYEAGAHHACARLVREILEDS